MANKALEWALWLAERGFLIAPLPAGEKRPTVKWKDHYTTDADRIRTWFECAPSMNYLVCPGEGFAVVDLDCKDGKDGIARFEELREEAIGEDPETFTVETTTGGRHLYFSVPHEVGNSADRIAPGIDIRGQGGYVVGPGSKFEGKPYKVLDDAEPAEAPDWVFTQMTAARHREEDADIPIFEQDTPDIVARAVEFLDRRRPAVEGEGGDEHTYVTFQLLKDLGVSKEKAFELVTQPGGWNDRCDPPWDHNEIAMKADNAYHYGKNRPGSKAAGIMDQYMPADMTDVTDLDLDAGEASEKDPFAALKSFVLRGEGIWNVDTYQRYVIPEWLPDKGYTCLLARRGTGKTTVMVDMASCLALDMDWHGWPTLSGYHVVYFCGEHDTLALQLFKAWREHNLGMDVAVDSRLLFVRHAGDLLDDEKTEAWMKYLRREIGPNGRAVVFLDTWQRATAHGSQSDDTDMQKATHNAEILASFLGGPMVVAAHPPKAEDEVVMGSSIIENNSAAILHLTNETVGKRLEVIRMKGLGEGNTMLMDFEGIDFGEEDEHGRPITGQAVTRLGGTSPNRGAPDDTAPEAPATQSIEERMNEKRQALGRFFIEYYRYSRSDDGDGFKLAVNNLADALARVSRGDNSDIDAILWKAGGPALFEKSSSNRTFNNMVKDCFIDPPTTVTVAADGEDWDVGFRRAGMRRELTVNKAYKGS